ncbi:MAG: hypothetical protein JKY65_16735 [Planctomycetes bacterium]|nr:hypothetical protein [Planctomycetota bacterium]
MRTAQRPLCETARHEDLLRHYLSGSLRTVESVDQLGNFLMGFGVLTLGYLLNAEVGRAAAAIGGAHHGLALLTLAAWSLAIGLLLAFVYIYIFRVLAGRSVHASEGREDAIGDVLPDLAPDLDFQGFMRHQRNFSDFLKTHYRSVDHQSPEALLYARYSYLRFMTLRKLGEMNRMRVLLGLGLAAGITFKLCAVYLGAL